MRALDDHLADRTTGPLFITKTAGRLDQPEAWHMEAYAKPSLKKYRPIAARNEDKKVFSGLL